MCIAYPARILALDAGSAVVDMAGRTRRASLLMTPDVEVGAWVLVAAGTVVRQIDAAEAHELAAQLDAAMAAATLPLPPNGQAVTAERPGGSS
jgi:hydrogenase assembly chaperone HypC/HupF